MTGGLQTCRTPLGLWLSLCFVLCLSSPCFAYTTQGWMNADDPDSIGMSEADFYRMDYIVPGMNDTAMQQVMRSAAAGVANSPPFGYRSGNPTRDHGCATVGRVPSHLRSSAYIKPSGLANFYQKYTHAYGIPVIASNQVSDNALKRACYTTRFLFAGHSRVRYNFYKYSGRVALIGINEGTNWIPEHSNLPAWWNTRARGLGATPHAPVSTGGEENVLCLSTDRYRAQDIFLHESAHGVHLLGARYGISGWDARLRAHYNWARSSGLWANTYSMSTPEELFAESTQAYFWVQSYSARPDGVRGPVNTRAKLLAYDPTIYRMIQEVFPCDNQYLKRCESTRALENAQVFNMDCDLGDGTGTTGGGGGGACTDDNTSCASWAGSGECTKNPAYMLTSCKKSCNKCPTTQRPTTQRPTTRRPITSAPTGGCMDNEQNCAYWSQQGYCTSYVSYMAEHCRKSCNLCTTTGGGGGNCNDSNGSCGAWANNGECDNNPAYMHESCKKSCELC